MIPPSKSPEPIATYTETRLEGRRSFVLHSDRLVMTSRGLSGEMELSFELAPLSPIVSHLRVRSKYFRLGFLMLTLPWFCAGMAAIAFQNITTVQLFVIPAGVSIVGLIMAAVSARKIEYARFASQAGVATIDIARAGREEAGYDAFIVALITQIQIAKGATQSSATPNGAPTPTVLVSASNTTEGVTSVSKH